MKKRILYIPSYRSKPANFVLWNGGLDFYVSKRIGIKIDSERRGHFVAFFRNEADAWKSADLRTARLIQTLEGYQKRFRRERRKAMK